MQTWSRSPISSRFSGSPALRRLVPPGSSEPAPVPAARTCPASLRPTAELPPRRLLRLSSIHRGSTHGRSAVVSAPDPAPVPHPAGARRWTASRVRRHPGRRATHRGALRLGTGTLYTAVARLAELGLIVDAGREDDRRRFYRLTPLGRAVLRAETARLEALVRHAHDRGIRPAPPAVRGDHDARVAIRPARAGDPSRPADTGPAQRAPRVRRAR